MSQAAHQVWMTVEGERFLVEVKDLFGDPIVAYVDGSRFEVSLQGNETSDPVREPKLQPDLSPHSIPAGASCEITAPMPGDIVEIHVSAGQSVKPGEALCVLDAMKMKNTIHAPQEGKVVQVCVQEGQSVEYGTPLFSLE